MIKATDIYLEQFARLGVFSKVEALASAYPPPPTQDNTTVIAAGLYLCPCKYHFVITTLYSVSYLTPKQLQILWHFTGS